MKSRSKQIFNRLQSWKIREAISHYLQILGPGSWMVSSSPKADPDNIDSRAQAEHREQRAASIQDGKDQKSENGQDDDQVER
jgi:hypothetical protein